MLTFMLFIVAINRIEGHSIAAHFDIQLITRARHSILYLEFSYLED